MHSLNHISENDPIQLESKSFTLFAIDVGEERDGHGWSLDVLRGNL